MKMYEVKYINKDGLLNTVTIEAENSVVYSVAVIEPEEDGTPAMKVHHTTLYGVSAESKTAKAKCLADAAKKFPNGFGYYIYNIDNA